MLPSGTFILLTLLFTLSLVVLGGLEYMLHRRRLSRIPIRIHINGTRGKSSVTRLIAAALRSSGIRTCAKTTGTLPRVIMPDGMEYPVFRPGRANIIEQLRIISTAAANECQALVLECMALQPYLQWLSEARIVRATCGVITNIRADHLDIMGPGERDVALALAGMIPRGGTLFSGDGRHLEIIGRAAKERGSELVTLHPDEVAVISQEELGRFSYIEHAENVALALKVCAALGVTRETALRGMWEARPDPGVMIDYKIRFFGRTLYFINAFAANDPESTERLWQISLDRFPDVKRHIAIFNCRIDRPERSLQLGRSFPHWQAADEVVLMGSGTFLFARAAVKEGLDASRITMVDDLEVDQIFEKMVELAGERALVVGMGNIAGPGLDLVRYFANRSVIERAA